MDNEQFRQEAHRLVDWMADYMENIEKYPVKSQVRPNEIKNQLPDKAPEEREAFEAIWKDFQEIIIPGITHWQNPNFHAYFPGNNSNPSILAEMLMATMGAQCMIWETSPAAAELEERVLDWLKIAMNLPSSWSGVIQDTASTATLAAILTAREKYSDFKVNESGVGDRKFRVYCSSETHSSIEKAVKIAGLGSSNLVKVPVNDMLCMETSLLREAIEKDVRAGLTPICVVSAFGTTGTVAIDDVQSISCMCQEFGIWHHIDAAYAGTALLLPEFHHLIQGVEDADSFVFNPHKWMFTNFDCTAYYVKDQQVLIKTFEILPEYLKTQSRGEVNDYRDWGVPLGRRFRALKLWFVIRSFGLEGIRQKLRDHIDLAAWMEQRIEEHPPFEMVLPRSLNTVVFRHIREGLTLNQLNSLNEKLINDLNHSGKIFLTHTKVNGIYCLRLPIGQTTVEKKHIQRSWELIKNSADKLY